MPQKEGDMMKKPTIKVFNRQTIPVFREQIVAALAALRKEMGIALKAKEGGKFTEATYAFTVEADLNFGGISGAEREFAHLASLYGLDEKVGDIIKYQG